MFVVVNIYVVVNLFSLIFICFNKKCIFNKLIELEILIFKIIVL